MREVLRTLRRHRELTWEMAKRQLTQGAAGQAFGAFWTFGHPLVLMAVYTLVFSVVFQMRTGGSGPGGASYPIYLLAGLVPWLTTATVLTASTAAVSGQANLVKQVLFPLEVLPARVCIAALVTQGIYVVLLLAYAGATSGHVPWTWALVPGLIALEALLLLGLSFAVSGVAVFVRDLKDLVVVGVAIGPYAAPIFYDPSMLPERLRPLLYLNPFTYLVFCWQDVVYHGRIERPAAWAVLALIALVTFWLGARIFLRLKRGFGDVV
jgi:lipopolysaccharide transport system permease protein